MKIIYFLFFILLCNNVFAFGVSPSNFEINLHNDESVEKEFTLINDEFETREFEISSYGIELFNFTKFNLKIEPQSQENIKFLISVPYEAIKGEYEGRIYVKKIKPEEGGVNLDALLGIKIKVNVESSFVETLKEINIDKTQVTKENNFLDKLKENPEILLFYALITFVLLLVIWKIFI